MGNTSARDAEDCGFDSWSSLLLFFVQHIKLSYFNTFNSTCDFSTTNLTDLDAFALRIRPPSECNELWRGVLGRSPRLGFSKLGLGLGLVSGLGTGQRRCIGLFIQIGYN